MYNETSSPKSNTSNTEEKIAAVTKRLKLLFLCLIVAVFLIVVTMALSAATLGTVVERLKTTITPTTSSTESTRSSTVPVITTTTSQSSLGLSLADSIQISDVMTHLQQLQNLATNTNGNRAVNTQGYNQTLDYITNYLSLHTNFQVQRAYFYLRNFVINSNLFLLTSVNGTEKNRTYSTTIAESEFYYMQYTRSTNLTNYISISSIPNLGCSDQDWQAANPPPAGQVALVKRGDCTFSAKAAFASKYNVSALFIYNDGTASDRFSPVFVSLGQSNELVALSLSYSLGKELADAAQDPTNNVRVRLIVPVADESTYPVGNICADTQTGDPQQTIVIGSHSDSVPAGPGINDNGKF